MKTLRLLPLLLLAACSSVPTYSEGHRKDGAPVYSARGFMVGYHMYYWRPWFAKPWWGKDPLPPYDVADRADAPLSPIARGWATTDDRGRVVISPALAARLRKP